MGSRITDYEALPWEEIVDEYMAGDSLRVLAERYGARDHKTLGKYLKIELEKRELKYRDHTASQRKRRALERLEPGDVENWHDYALGHPTRRGR